jgi:hypothetical protein
VVDLNFIGDKCKLESHFLFNDARHLSELNLNEAWPLSNMCKTSKKANPWVSSHKARTYAHEINSNFRSAVQTAPNASLLAAQAAMAHSSAATSAASAAAAGSFGASIRATTHHSPIRTSTNAHMYRVKQPKSYTMNHTGPGAAARVYGGLKTSFPSIKIRV